ncbi:MAG TPA: SRPBCC family protein [Steroidobacteraceae bacterium]|nr:SRPBCC family protein [Steroidobacteraceae bacterium]
MASIYRTFIVDAAPEFVWDAIRDVGAVHERLAHAFVTDTQLEGSTRTVTFANGLVAREQIVAIDDENRRLVYSIVGGRTAHHNAFFQVFPAPGGNTEILWVTDLLPDEMREPIGQMVELGCAAMKRTLETNFAAAR